VRVRLEQTERGIIATPLLGKALHREIAESNAILLVPAGIGLSKGEKTAAWVTK